MAGDLERLAYEAALRALDKQERLLEEVRARTGMILAASSIAGSFIGNVGFRESRPGVLALLALLAFVISIVACAYVLAPRSGLVFALGGPGLYEALYRGPHDAVELHRRLIYWLHDLWAANDRVAWKLARVQRVAAGMLVVEVLLLATLVSDTII